MADIRRQEFDISDKVIPSNDEYAGSMTKDYVYW